MKDKWYGDRRDLLKWGTLLHLAASDGATILQVAFARSDPAETVERNGEAVPLYPTIWQHFRDLSGVRRLGEHAGIAIDIVDDQFDHRARENYVVNVLARLEAAKRPVVVLLDPDTGLSRGVARAAHVAPGEVRNIWDALKPGDWLVLYQHALRKKNWRSVKRGEFAAACGDAHVDIFTARWAKDVVLLAASVRPTPTRYSSNKRSAGVFPFIVTTSDSLVSCGVSPADTPCSGSASRPATADAFGPESTRSTASRPGTGSTPCPRPRREH
jgi:hypothetical protein